MDGEGGLVSGDLVHPLSALTPESRAAGNETSAFGGRLIFFRSRLNVFFSLSFIGAFADDPILSVRADTEPGTRQEECRAQMSRLQLRGCFHIDC